MRGDDPQTGQAGSRSIATSRKLVVSPSNRRSRPQAFTHAEGEVERFQGLGGPPKLPPTLPREFDCGPQRYRPHDPYLPSARDAPGRGRFREQAAVTGPAAGQDRHHDSLPAQDAPFHQGYPR